jgi:hypothetical protein
MHFAHPLVAWQQDEASWQSGSRRFPQDEVNRFKDVSKASLATATELRC